MSQTPPVIPDEDQAQPTKRGFSWRNLIVLAVLVGAYLACWGPTRRFAALQAASEPITEAGKTSRIVEASAPLPLIVSQNEAEYFSEPSSPRGAYVFLTRYYLWLFGPIYPLPWESLWEPENPVQPF